MHGHMNVEMILHSKRARKLTQNKHTCKNKRKTPGKTKVNTLHHFARPGPTAYHQLGGRRSVDHVHVCRMEEAEWVQVLGSRRCVRPSSKLKTCKAFRRNNCSTITLPETNSKFAPEHGWLEDQFPLGIPYFQGHTVSFWEVYLLEFQTL